MPKNFRTISAFGPKSAAEFDWSDRDQCLYDRLRSVLGEYITPDELRQELGWQAVDLEERLTSLRESGVDVVYDPGLGMRLTKIPEGLSAVEIRHGIATVALGRQVVVRDHVTSTNDVAAEMASSLPPGTVVAAEFQTRGRGRRGRRWRGGDGENLLFSIILPTPTSLATPGLSTLLVAYATARAVTLHCGLQARVKWPNDLVTCTATGDSIRKFGGVLCEIRKESAIVGVGINVNQQQFDGNLPNATSILQQVDKRFNRNVLLKKILQQLDEEFARLEQGGNAIVAKMRNFSVTLGRRVIVSTETGAISGLATDLDGDGALLVKDDHGVVHRLLSGDITSAGVLS